MGDRETDETDTINADEPFVCLYVDNSNIFHEGQRFAQHQRMENRYDFRIDFNSFLQLVLRNRTVREVVWGGSLPENADHVWQALRDRGISPDSIPRSSTGENDTVDHLIQLQMYRHVRKYRETPGTIVLCTGDGKGYEEEKGFLYDVEGHVAEGWKLEVVSWSHSCHRRLKEFAKETGSFMPLDHYYDAITFIKGGRSSSARL